MICAQTILHFRPNASYETYLKLLVSVMILIQLFLPIGSLFSGGGRDGAAKQLESFRASLEEGMRLAEEQAAETDRILEQMTLEQLRNLAEQQNAEQRAVTHEGESGLSGLDETGEPAENVEQGSLDIMENKTEAVQDTEKKEEIKIEIAPVEVHGE